jgi:hypothetical protein
MFLNKINPIYLFVTGFVLVIIGALLKIMHIPFSTVFLFWGIALKIYAMIRFGVLLNHNFKSKREQS